MSQKLHATSKILTEAAKIHETCLVGFSGGKDSLALLDLSLRHFKKCIAWYMEFPVGAPTQRAKLQAQCDAWNVPLVFVPHFDFVNALLDGTYCDVPDLLNGIDHMTQREIFNWLKLETKIDCIVFGRKRADSMWARRWFYLTRNWKDVVNPLADWTKAEVLAYCKMRNLTVPEESKMYARFNYCLNQDSLAMMRQLYPEDYAVMLKWFPYAEATHKRDLLYYTEGLADEELAALK